MRHKSRKITNSVTDTFSIAVKLDKVYLVRVGCPDWPVDVLEFHLAGIRTGSFFLNNVTVLNVRVRLNEHRTILMKVN